MFTIACLLSNARLGLCGHSQGVGYPTGSHVQVLLWANYSSASSLDVSFPQRVAPSHLVLEDSRLMCLKCFSLHLLLCSGASEHRFGFFLREIWWKSTFPERTCSWSQSCFTPKCFTSPHPRRAKIPLTADESLLILTSISSPSSLQN